MSQGTKGLAVVSCVLLVAFKIKSKIIKNDWFDWKISKTIVRKV